MTLRIDATRRHVMALAAGAALVVTLVLSGAPVARADTLSVFADLPVAMTLKLDNGQGTSDSGSASGLSGYKVGITLPIFVGLAYESYGSKFNLPNFSSQSFNYDVTMYDLFLNLPLPIVNIAAGLGAGTGKFSNLNSNGATVKDATLGQYFVSLGFNVLPLFDIHAGYHVWSGSHDVSGGGSVTSVKANGDMWSIGAKLGF